VEDVFVFVEECVKYEEDVFVFVEECVKYEENVFVFVEECVKYEDDDTGQLSQQSSQQTHL